MQSGETHVMSWRVLAAVFAALALLTGLTVAASQVDMGAANLYVALLLAATKAALVLLYFMHLRYDRPFNLAVFAICLAFVVLFISLVLTDTQANRPSLLSEEAKSMQGVHTPFGR